MGRAKASLPADDRDTFLTRIVRTFLAAGVDDVVVVVGHEAEAIAAAFAASGLPARFVVNTAEGMYARGKQRTASYNIALREMRESYAALEVSVLLRYLPPLRAELEDRIQRIIGTLYRLTFPRQAASR